MLYDVEKGRPGVKDVTFQSRNSSIDTCSASAPFVIAGDQCTAIAADQRCGTQTLTVATACRIIFQMNHGFFSRLASLMTGIQTVSWELRFGINLLELRERQQIEPAKFTALVKSLLCNCCT
jgi:hypothetical protein